MRKKPSTAGGLESMDAGDALPTHGRASRAPRLRDPEDKSDPVELLLDITFVSLLNQPSDLVLHDAGPDGTLRALAVLLVTVLFWQMTAAATGIVPLDGVLRLLYLAKTGAFLLMAVSVHEAFEPGRGPLAGPVLFAGATTLAGLCSVGMWVHVGAADRRWRGNAALLVGFAAVMSVFACLAARHAGNGESVWLLTGYGLSILLCSNTAIPYPRKLGIGSLVDGWAINGAHAYRERYTTAYIVGCCLSLELLEMAAARRFGGPRLPVALAVLFAAFAVSCLLYWLYEPLIDPARRVVDPRNAALSHPRKVAHSLGDVYGHILMFCGLVLVASGLRSCFTGALDSGPSAGGVLGPAVDVRTVAGLCGGVALCLAGQAFFSLVTVWRPDPLRIGGACCAAAAIPALRGRPVVLVVLVPFVLLACVYALDRRRAAASAQRRDPAASRWRGSRLLRRVPRVDGHHAVSSFELFFDFLAAFAFAQVGNLLLHHPGLSDALRTLLVLGCVYGCWISYCAAANAA
jgi:low temperature requirement protein LtrA